MTSLWCHDLKDVTVEDAAACVVTCLPSGYFRVRMLREQKSHITHDSVIVV